MKQVGQRKRRHSEISDIRPQVYGKFPQIPLPHIPTCPRRPNVLPILSPCPEAQSERSLSPTDCDALVKACSSVIYYAYTTSPPKISFSPKRHAFNTIISYFKGGILEICDVVLDRIYEMLRSNIFHSVPVRVDSSILLSDSPVCYYITNEDDLKRCYEILGLMIDDYLDKKLKEKDIIDIINVMSSPARFESNLALDLLQTIYLKFEKFRDYTIRSLFSCIVHFNEGEFPVFGVSPIFIFLRNCFIKLERAPSQVYYKLFKSVIYPTILSPYLPNYYNTFTDLIQIFTSKDPLTTLWCVKFLLKHWPISSSIKQSLFLNQIQILLSQLYANYLPEIESDLLYIIETSLQSPNYKVVMAAINSCDHNFLELLSGAGADMNGIYSALVEATHNFDDTVCELAEYLLKSCNDIFSKCQMPKPSSKEQECQEKWRKIYQIANINSLCLDQIPTFSLSPAFHKLMVC